MLPVSVTTIRLFLHVLAATVWVGGQITLGALVPALRGFDGATRAAARRFAYVGWTAFAVVVLTGVWNWISQEGTSSQVKTTLGVKLVFVLLSGVGAYLHSRSKTPRYVAIWGAVGAVGALAALFFGVQIG